MSKGGFSEDEESAFWDDFDRSALPLGLSKKDRKTFNMFQIFWDFFIYNFHLFIWQ